MSEFPWFKFYPSDWLAGTRGMSAAETGIYITLIATMYERQEPIREDIGRLARVCGASNSSFKKSLEILIQEGKIDRRDGLLWNNRVGRECETRSEKSEVARQSANRRWDTSGEKPQQKQQPDNANAEHTQCDGNANQKSDTRSQNKKKDSARKSKPTYPEFENFWIIWQGKPQKWPTHIKAEALPYWLKLSDDQRMLATEAALQYQAACLKADHPPKHACRYLEKTAFAGFQPQAPAQSFIEVAPGTPEHKRWTSYFHSLDKPWMAKAGPMLVPSQLPPEETVQ